MMCAKFSIIVMANIELARGVGTFWPPYRSGVAEYIAVITKHMNNNITLFIGCQSNFNSVWSLYDFDAMRPISIQ